MTKKEHGKISFVKFFLTSIFLLLALPLNGLATTEENSGTATGFNYQVDFPENQTDTSLGYYDLMMTPGQQQTITLTLSNPSEESVTVNLDLNGAKTNSNGVIEYAANSIENDPSLAYDFTEIVSGPDSVELAAGETKQLELTIQMPEASFDGVIAGGLVMQRPEEEAAQSDDASGGSRVGNRYRYAVSILLRESDVEVAPELSFNEAFAEQQNYRNTIFVNYSNIAATYVNGLTVQAQISESGSSQVLWESRKTGMRMAPNSFMNFPISMNGDRMTPGTYTAHVNAYVGDQSWEWTEEFEITQEEADEFNERDVGLVQDRGFDWQIIAIIVGGFLAVVLLGFLVVRRIRRQNKKNKKDKRKK
ncbi:DUF916 and DUF3324 domain-containing protein [Enterococcus sp. LJL120]